MLRSGEKPNEPLGFCSLQLSLDLISQIMAIRGLNKHSMSAITRSFDLVNQPEATFVIQSVMVARPIGGRDPDAGVWCSSSSRASLWLLA